MYETLATLREGHLTWLTLNRPDALNALSRQMVNELRDFFWTLTDDRETRVVVVRGAGRAFCAGLDLKEAGSGDGAGGGSVAGSRARMNAAFIRLGVSGCDIGVSYFLPRTVGASVAAELLLTGDFIDAARAERTGLVSRVVSDDQLEDCARTLAQSMLRNAPLALRLTKECLKHSIDAGSLEQAIAMEDRNQALAGSTRDFREGVAAFLQKRPANFEDA